MVPVAREFEAKLLDRIDERGSRQMFHGLAALQHAVEMP
jgi:hypothetical protein